MTYGLAVTHYRIFPAPSQFKAFHFGCSDEPPATNVLIAIGRAQMLEVLGMHLGFLLR